jgi:hypothetical protein
VLRGAGPGGYFLNFTEYGLQINAGHEVMMDRCWLGETNFDYDHEKHGTKPNATAIQINGNDHYILNTIVFSSKIGLEVNGAADYSESPPSSGHSLTDWLTQSDSESPTRAWAVQTLTEWVMGWQSTNALLLLLLLLAIAVTGVHVWFPVNHAVFFHDSIAFHITGGGNRLNGCYIDGGRAIFTEKALTKNIWTNGFECCQGAAPAPGTTASGILLVPAPVNISVKRLKLRLSGSARKSQKRFRDTPKFKFQAVLARIQPFQRSNERSEQGDHPVWLSGSHTNIDRSR